MILCCDIDGTLADNRWREKLLHGYGELDEYFMALEWDPVIEITASLINSLHRPGSHTFCLTSRPEKYRGLTCAWLIKHNIMYTGLFMRWKGDARSSPEVKVDMLNKILAYGYPKKDILLMDNRVDVIQAANLLGYATVHFSLGGDR